MSTTTINFDISATTERSIKTLVLGAVREAVEVLAAKHGFDAKDAMAGLEVARRTVQKKPKQEPKKKTKPSIPLPFCGVIDEDTCHGIRVNHGLHTQCTNAKQDTFSYCKTCNKQAVANDTGEPNAGDIHSRGSGIIAGVDFRSSTWKPVSKVVRYGNVMARLGISRAEALAAAEVAGVTIPEAEFEVVKGRRGRPKKAPTASSSDEEGETKPKRGRGRPKKIKTVVSVSAGDDLISQLVQDAKTAVSSSSSDDETTQVASQVKPTLAMKPEEPAQPVAAASQGTVEVLKAVGKITDPDQAAVALDAYGKRLTKEKEEKEKAAKAAKAAKAKIARAAKAAEAKAAKAEAAKAEAAKAAAAKEAVLSIEEELSSDSEEEEELSVRAFEHAGKKYLRDDEDQLYDVFSHDLIGNWTGTAVELVDLV